MLSVNYSWSTAKSQQDKLTLIKTVTTYTLIGLAHDSQLMVFNNEVNWEYHCRSWYRYIRQNKQKLSNREYLIGLLFVIIKALGKEKKGNKRFWTVVNPKGIKVWLLASPVLPTLTFPMLQNEDVLVYQCAIWCLVNNPWTLHSLRIKVPCVPHITYIFLMDRHFLYLTIN